jgi:hypothetical protein
MHKQVVKTATAKRRTPTIAIIPKAFILPRSGNDSLEERTFAAI